MDRPACAPAQPRLRQAQRLAALRAEMDQQALDGFLVPRADEYQGEYVPPAAERLAWISGFSGSAGQACVLRERAAVFVDGRYTLQAREEVADALFELHDLDDQSLSAFLASHLTAGNGGVARLGYDPRVHTQDQVRRIKETCRKLGGEAVACAQNPLDLAWRDRPAAPQSTVQVQELRYSGEDSRDKRRALGIAAKAVLSFGSACTMPNPALPWCCRRRCSMPMVGSTGSLIRQN